MKLTTATGKKFSCDSVTTSSDKKCLFLHLTKTDPHLAAATFSDPAELPLEGFPNYTKLSTLSIQTNGRINVCLI